MILAEKGVNLDHVKFTGVKLTTALIDIISCFYSVCLQCCGKVLSPNKGTQIKERKIRDKNLS